MSLRFRKSIKLAPGIRWNISGSGLNFTLGPRGASINVGKRGAYSNTSLPGTGISSRTRLESPKPAATPPASSVKMTCSVAEDGTLGFVGLDGQPVSEHFIELAKKQNREAILQLIQSQCDQINGAIEALGELHVGTPDCRVAPLFVRERFQEPSPTPPTERTVGFFAMLFGQRARIEQANAEVRQRHKRSVELWKQQKAAHDAEQDRRRRFIEEEIRSNVDAMEAFLEERLNAIPWPRETKVTFDLRDDGSTVMLDVDLPELEEMPSKTVAVPARGLKLSVKEMSATKVQTLYLRHVHGIVFRLIGEAFAALHSAKTVVVSGFTTRADPGTAIVKNDYVLSVRATRRQWQRLNFEALDHIDVVVALQRFECRCDSERTKKLRSITPFAN